MFNQAEKKDFTLSTLYFKNGDMRCRLKEIRESVYQVVVIEVDDEIVTDVDEEVEFPVWVEVWYLELFEEFKDAIQAMLDRGFCGCDEYQMEIGEYPTTEEMYWLKANV